MPALPCVEAKFIRRLHKELIIFVYLMQTRDAADMENCIQNQRSPKIPACKYLGKNFSTSCCKYKIQGKNRRN